MSVNCETTEQPVPVSHDVVHDQRAQNRADFPAAAALMDEYRRVFGAEVKLRWWVEGGRSIGDVPSDALQPCSQK
jgi:hypothetical protein